MSDDLDLSRRYAIESLRYRLMGFVVGMALLGLLGAPWQRTSTLVPESDPPRYAPDFVTGIGLLQDQTDIASVLVILYLLFTLIVLVSAKPKTVILCAAGGLSSTVILLVTDSDWTGAPAVALVLWMIGGIVGALAWKDS